MRLSANQIRLFNITLYLVGIWAVFSWLVGLGFGWALGLWLLVGGLIHGFAHLAQGGYYFLYRGSAEAPKMLAALGWGMAIKFGIVIVISSLLLYYVEQVHPLGLISGIVSMHLLHSIVNVFFMH